MESIRAYESIFYRSEEDEYSMIILIDKIKFYTTTSIGLNICNDKFEWRIPFTLYKVLEDNIHFQRFFFLF